MIICLNSDDMGATALTYTTRECCLEEVVVRISQAIEEQPRSSSLVTCTSAPTKREADARSVTAG